MRILRRALLLIFGFALLATSFGLLLARQSTPDSAWLVYVSDDDDYLYRIRRDGAGRQQLNRTAIFARHPVWSPDGHWIAFDALIFGQSNSSRVYQMRLNGSQMQRVSPQRPPQAIIVSELPPPKIIASQETRPVWSADGEWLYYMVRAEGVQNLYRTRPGDTRAQRLTDFTLGGGIRLDDFGLAPDSQKILLGLSNTHEDEDRQSLVVADADGGNPVTLVQDAPGVYSPAWSPDSAWVLFYGTPGSGYGLYQVRPNGTGLRRMNEIHQGAQAMWSPDGAWLLIKPIPASRLLRVRTDGGEMQAITPAFDAIMRAKWSAGSEWIAFTTLSTTGRTSLYRVRADGSDLRQIAEGVEVNSFDWSPIISREWGAGGLFGMGMVCVGLGILVRFKNYKFFRVVASKMVKFR